MRVLKVNTNLNFVNPSEIPRFY